MNSLTNISTSNSTATVFATIESNVLKTRTPSETRTDIGAAASGSNSDITALTGLSGVSAKLTSASKFAVMDGNEIKTRTGAETRSDIGAASSGDNSDITNLTGLSNIAASSSTGTKFAIIENNELKTRTATELRTDIGASDLNKIYQGDSSVEVIDTGSGYIKFSTDGSEKNENIIKW